MTAHGIAKVKLGRTNLTVSKICFGMSAVGDMPNNYGYHVDEERGKQTVRAVFDGPINFLDTSRMYGSGRSEERIGAVIRERGGLPAGFVLSTKLDRDMESNRFDAAQARRSLEESLAALNLERVQLLHLHDPEYVPSLADVTGPDGSLAALFQMREEGLAEAVGLAAGKVDVMMPLLRDWDFDAVLTHNRYTLLNRNAEELIDFAQSKGVAVLNAAPYGSGLLAKGSESSSRYAYQEPRQKTRQSVRAVEGVCVKHGIPLGAAALQFSLGDRRITSTVCGISKPERIEQTLEWATWPISEEVWSDLMALSFTSDDPEETRDYQPD